MNPQLLLPIGLLFVAIAVVTGVIASAVLARTAPERRRLRNLAPADGPDLDLPESAGLLLRMWPQTAGRQEHA